MTEKLFAAQAVVVEKQCPVCIHGFMRFTQMDFSNGTTDIKNQHQCNECAHIELYDSDTRYPMVRHIKGSPYDGQ